MLHSISEKHQVKMYLGVNCCWKIHDECFVPNVIAIHIINCFLSNGMLFMPRQKCVKEKTSRIFVQYQLSLGKWKASASLNLIYYCVLRC
jgi:hypothetical protein